MQLFMFKAIQTYFCEMFCLKNVCILSFFKIKLHMVCHFIQCSLSENGGAALYNGQMSPYQIKCPCITTSLSYILFCYIF